MSKWIKNLYSYEENKEKRCCPHCGSERIDVEEMVHGEQKSLSFLCLECGKGEHFDGTVK